MLMFHIVKGFPQQLPVIVSQVATCISVRVANSDFRAAIRDNRIASSDFLFANPEFRVLSAL